MDTTFPLHYSLENGTEVTVQHQGDGVYHFTLKPEEGPVRHFDYVEGQHTKAEWDELTDFELLDALRAFWLRTEDVV